jgi:hypothetical protein
MNEKPTPRKPSCPVCDAMICKHIDGWQRIMPTEWQREKIAQNKRAIYESRKRDLADMRMFPLRD